MCKLAPNLRDCNDNEVDDDGDGETDEPESLGAIGVDELRWLRPLRPGDTLRGTSEVIDKKASKSRPEMGIVRNKVTILNQDDQPVLIMIPIAMWRTRPA